MPAHVAETQLEARAGVEPAHGPFLVHVLDAIVYPDLPERLVVALQWLSAWRFWCLFETLSASPSGRYVVIRVVAENFSLREICGAERTMQRSWIFELQKVSSEVYEQAPLPARLDPRVHAPGISAPGNGVARPPRIEPSAGVPISLSRLDLQ